jgi:serine/threonine protein kinase
VSDSTLRPEDLDDLPAKPGGLEGDIAATRRYEPICPLGRGGMGEVWRVRDRTLSRTVALKVIRTDRIVAENSPL